MIHDPHSWSLVRIVVVVVLVVLAEQFCWGGGRRGIRSVRAFVPSPVLECRRRRCCCHSRQQPPLRFSEAEDDHTSADNSTTTSTTTTTSSSSTMDDDWRDVRARLIRQFKQQQLPPQGIIGQITNSSPVSSSSSTTTTTTTTTNWAYDSGGVIERGSLIVSHPVQDFACGGLRQQYFTKCVVLVVKDDKSFTKGVILNRNSLSYPVSSSSSASASSSSPGGTTTSKSFHHPWTIYYGGDVQGIDSPETDYTCLHQLKSPLAQEWSLPIVKDIQVRTNTYRSSTFLGVLLHSVIYKYVFCFPLIA